MLEAFLRARGVVALSVACGYKLVKLIAAIVSQSIIRNISCQPTSGLGGNQSQRLIWRCVARITYGIIAERNKLKLSMVL